LVGSVCGNTLVDGSDESDSMSSIFFMIGEYCVPRLTYRNTRRGDACTGVGDDPEELDFLRAPSVVVRVDNDTYWDCCWSLGEGEVGLNRG
jgi:hypothetical protein